MRLDDIFLEQVALEAYAADGPAAARPHRFHEGWDYQDRLDATLKHFHALGGER